MKLLNVGCGAVRPGTPWINLDSLRTVLSPGTPERAQLDSEPNYVDHDLAHALPFPDYEFDGVLISHVVEHFDCHEAARILSECRRVLKPDGLLIVSVPNASYFLDVHDLDTRERAEELFGEPICPAEPEHKNFFDYALFYKQHRQVLNEDTLYCLLLRAGFDYIRIYRSVCVFNSGAALELMQPLLNRLKFSTVLCAVR